MLVLSRRPSEGIQFTYDVNGETKTVQIKIIDIAGRKVRLGIEAPDEVTILRDELVPQTR